jgi:hypothetical protein
MLELGPAERAFRRAIALDSTQADPYIRLVDVLVSRNRTAEARQLIDVAVRRFPDEAVQKATVAYAEGRRDQMRDILETRARVPVNGLVDFWLNLAWLNLLEGRLAEWDRDAPTAIARRSADARLLMLSADYWVRSRPAENVRALDSLLAADPSQRRNLDAAVLYAQFNRPAQAKLVLTAHDAAMAAEGRHGAEQDAARWSTMGWISLDDGRPVDAIAEFRRARALSDLPSDAGPIATDPEIGLAFERAGLPDSAIASYEHFLKTPFADRFWNDAPQLAWVLEHVAVLYEAKGRRRDARLAYGRMADLWKAADAELQPRVITARQRVAAHSPWWSVFR